MAPATNAAGAAGMELHATGTLHATPPPRLTGLAGALAPLLREHRYIGASTAVRGPKVVATGRPLAAWPAASTNASECRRQRRRGSGAGEQFGSTPAARAGPAAPCSQLLTCSQAERSDAHDEAAALPTVHLRASTAAAAALGWLAWPWCTMVPAAEAAEYLDDGSGGGGVDLSAGGLQNVLQEMQLETPYTPDPSVLLLVVVGMGLAFWVSNFTFPDMVFRDTVFRSVKAQEERERRTSDVVAELASRKNSESAPSKADDDDAESDSSDGSTQKKSPRGFK